MISPGYSRQEPPQVGMVESHAEFGSPPSPENFFFSDQSLLLPT